MFEILFIIFLIVNYAFIYFRFYSKEKIIFFKFFLLFIFYTITVYIILENYIISLDFNNEITIALVVFYLLSFCSLILIINLKSLFSPSDYIYQYLIKNKSCSPKNIISYLKKKNIIKKRIADLKKQKLLKKNKNYLELTNFGKIFILFFLIIKKFYNLKSEG